MSLEAELGAELESVRRLRDSLAREAELDLLRRYDRRTPVEALGPYGRLRRIGGNALRALGLLPPIVIEPWRPGLRHQHGGGAALTPLLVWAMGVERDRLREVCRRLQALQGGLEEFAPVLLTDVADFAFFSRLGWLVEFVPHFAAPAERYRERKLRYLAWRYRDAPVLPATAGLTAESHVEDIRRWVLEASTAAGNAVHARSMSGPHGS